MKVVLISMPDVVPIIIHEMAIHMPSHGIACIGGNIDERHEVYLIDLIRKRNDISAYLTKTLKRITPDLVGLSAMTWQYSTCLALSALIKSVLPQVKIAVGGYHATLMSREMAGAPEFQTLDFIIRGEGEETFRRLVNTLDGMDSLVTIPSLSYKQDGHWIHNDQGTHCDLSRLKLPIRDHRRLTNGYHFMYSKIEVMETSRGCTHNCSFCCINNMYGRTYRTYPIERILADLDDIYFNRKTKLVFITDDNMVLNPKWVMNLCDAIIERKYQNLRLAVQADCMSMARNEMMVKKMSQAGFGIVFLGIENASSNNLQAMEKADVSKEAKRAVENCQRYGIMVIGGLIFGLPDDDEDAVKQNYQFLIDLGVDASYCQMLSPFPKTKLRKYLLSEGLIINHDRYELYNGLWANVKTRRMEAEQLQYAFWYYRQTVLGWWKPSAFVAKQGRLWTSIWMYMVKPAMKYFVDRQIRKIGWEGRYQRHVQLLKKMNSFEELKTFRVNGNPEQLASREKNGGDAP